MDKFPDCITHAYVMLTEECPCRCEYCWVKDRANHLTITEDKIEALVNRFSGNTKPLLIFFGGEPLLKQDLIANTVEKYKDKCTFQVVTSGMVNFNKFMDTIYKPNKDIFDVQLSWDGLKTNSRHLLSGVNKTTDIYNLLIENLEKGYNIETRGVISDCNVENWLDMHKTIANLKLKYPNLSEDYNLAHQKAFRSSFYKQFDSESKNVLTYIKTSLETEKNAFISQWFLQLIYNILTEEPSLSCDSGNYMCMRPNGELYPCTILSQYGKEFCIGNIDDTNLDFSVLESLSIESKCEKTCKMKEICDGGCRYERVINYKNWKNKICSHTCKIKRILKQNIITFLNELPEPDRQIVINRSIKWANWFTEYHIDSQKARNLSSTKFY